MRTCSVCGTSDIHGFGKCSRNKDGLSGRCKVCDRLATSSWRATHRKEHRAMCTRWQEANPDKCAAKSAKYNNLNRAKRTAQERRRVALKIQSIPKWFDEVEVNYIYSIAKEKVLHVDHIVPLNSKLVCGLHVQDNLRCVSQKLNSHKGNRYWPDMWQER